MNTAKGNAVKAVEEKTVGTQNAVSEKKGDESIIEQVADGKSDYDLRPTVEAMARRIAELEAFAVKVRQKLHFADQEVQRPLKRNYNPDYLPQGEGIISYHDKPKAE